MPHGVRKLLVLAASTVLPAASATVLAAPAHAAAPAFPAHYSAPYLQISAADAGDMAADKNATGTALYSLAFLTPQSGCTPMWEDNNDAMNAFTSQVSALQAAGGNVIPSFGGASGGELAQTCTSVSSLEAAYAKVVSTYHVTRLDFDIEGSVLDDTASDQRRDQALAQLQAANPAVQIDFTVPVDPTGMESDVTSMLTGAVKAGVKVNLVNIMTMDFGNGENALNDAESAANGSVPQLESIFGISGSGAWGMLGLTPIAGQNDDNEVFSQSDASTLESFAAAHGVQELAFWEVDGYDKGTGYAYSKIFNKITGGSTGGGGGGSFPSGYHRLVVQHSGLCVDVAGASTSNGAAIEQNSCATSGQTSQELQFLPVSGGYGELQDQNSGKDLVVQSASTTNGAAIIQYTQNGTANGLWLPVQQADGTWQFKNQNSGLCLDQTGAVTTAGATFDQWTCKTGTGTNQDFRTE
ncbi:RICIN domain-containing protein [Streptacidiphilus jiangxiensis]|uniref:Chitinase n=1 Tax=Streptacidiphilus jiangxiensis TaxID=235985 RepID=A0A1H7UNL5_STRJI|nr:RICIN domain-containing protein [Streptacidiphilus jiangxiensis]SEL98386.1 chitinase [Streptacidiphilus jiangxiensis]